MVMQAAIPDELSDPFGFFASTAADVRFNCCADTSPLFIPGFSENLTVDVYSGTPQPVASPIPDYIGAGKAAAAALDYPLPSKEEVSKQMALQDFIPVGTGGVDFPSARPTSLIDLFNTGLGLASSLIQGTSNSLVQTLPNTQVMQVNTQAAVCPPSRLGHRQHLTKPRKGVPQHCAPNRHMNSLNPKALRRATTRLRGFMNHVQSAQKAIRHALGHTVTAPRRRSTRGGCVQCGRTARNCVC